MGVSKGYTISFNIVSNVTFKLEDTGYSINFTFYSIIDASTREKPAWRKTGSDSTSNDSHVGRFRRMRSRVHQEETNGNPADTSAQPATPQVRYVAQNRYTLNYPVDLINSKL